MLFVEVTELRTAVGLYPSGKEQEGHWSRHFNTNWQFRVVSGYWPILGYFNADCRACAFHSRGHSASSSLCTGDSPLIQRMKRVVLDFTPADGQRSFKHAVTLIVLVGGAWRACGSTCLVHDCVWVVGSQKRPTCTTGVHSNQDLTWCEKNTGV